MDLSFFQPEETVPFKVIARCRPLTEDEESKGCKSIVSMSGDKTVIQSAGKVGII